VDNVPLLNVETRDYGNDPVAYYQEHHPGLTRGQLQKKDRSLYMRLWREGLLDNVPLKSNNIKDQIITKNIKD